MLGTYTDNRPDVMGVALDIDAQKFTDLCALAGMPLTAQVDVALVAVDPEHADYHGTCTPVDENPDHWQVELPVSDRFEYSDKAVERVNRNLLHVLRHGAQIGNYMRFFGPADGMEGETKMMRMSLVSKMIAATGKGLEIDAYAVERSIKDDPSKRCLTPQPVVLATEDNA